MHPAAIGPFKIERELGRGGMGVTYPAFFHHSITDHPLLIPSDACAVAAISINLRFTAPSAPTSSHPISNSHASSTRTHMHRARTVIVSSSAFNVSSRSFPTSAVGRFFA